MSKEYSQCVEASQGGRAGGREANNRTKLKNNLQYNRIIERMQPTFASEQAVSHICSQRPIPETQR